ncbi:Imm26 family immunity protein [Pseudomonas syringae]|uniref:Imm26 family immunity protein n=1 Tax=Pseudomonas syringae TaxID=317 RepID=UPI0018E64A0D|nr:Imm26 family immunity protein [Pseudomonas syringae]MBI6753540.1 phosphotriesterase [Pseudomonas syringae]MBI6773759.1 phosphotriesterase [Pseudomonas syringae]MBI6777198.1 phosphotriesterase [Pseudomonas syringae]MBI6793442.1 phosphotriesterase [Pseudomonas syringae]MBI6803164.1 phosphotriesterase [Pseudomonas syringae]
MSKLKAFKWEESQRKQLRYIKPGDIFCFDMGGEGYGVGRIMTRNSLGHVAEIFKVVLEKPQITCSDLTRVGDPVIIDSYSLFDRKTEGDWRIIAHDSDYIAPSGETTRFIYGVADNRTEVDIFDNEYPSKKSLKELPRYSPKGDSQIKEIFMPLINKGGE